MSKSKDKKKGKSQEKPVTASNEFTPSQNFLQLLKRTNFDLPQEQNTNNKMGGFKLNPTTEMKLEPTFKIPQGPLESIDDGPKISISKMQKKEKLASDHATGHVRARKYDVQALGLTGINTAEDQPEDNNAEMEIEVDEKLLKPSTIYQLEAPRKFRHTIFQTPVLPFRFPLQAKAPKEEKTEQQKFFSVQYDSCGNEVTNSQQMPKQGVFKIGKIKIKGDKAEITLGDIKMEASLGYGQGKGIAIADGNLYELGRWEGIWLVQPKDEIFQ